MNILLKIYHPIPFLLFIFSSLLFSQSFDKNVLIDIPGDNYDFDLLKSSEGYPIPENFITWVNKNDSVYTVFLKLLSPVISDVNIVISSDNMVKSNPKVAYNSDGPGIRIVWENFTSEYFQIAECNYYNDSLSSKIILEDSLTQDPQISLCPYRMAMIIDNKLYIKAFYPEISDPILVDSFNCSSPDILTEDFIFSSVIIYERVIAENHQIWIATRNDNTNWSYDLISDGDNRNPNFGANPGVSFESISGGISRIKYSGYYTYQNLMETKNLNCNYRNPNVFSYPIPVNPVEETPFFVAFDTDSLENNNEVFIKTFFNEMYDSLINISDMEGDDFKPETGFLYINDSSYALIVWLHRENNKTNIWMAKAEFNPIYNSVEDEKICTKSFDLMQNYPNPFNPSTTIKFRIPETEQVCLKIYNILGQQLDELINGIMNEGIHEFTFNASGLASGVYLYRLESGNKILVRKMLVLK